MRQICKEIIDNLAEVSGLANGTIGNLNMVGLDGVEPTEEERKVLNTISEDFCRQARQVVRQWLARLPQE